MFDSLSMCASAFQSFTKPQLNVASGDTVHSSRDYDKQTWSGYKYVKVLYSSQSTCNHDDLSYDIPQLLLQNFESCVYCESPSPQIMITYRTISHAQFQMKHTCVYIHSHEIYKTRKV